MSKSFNTQKEWVKANRRMNRNKKGEFLLPRIIERKPFPGDVHPVSKGRLSNLLRRIPVEYLYGLKAIEFRPRKSDIGEPFAYYSRDEKRIILYSLPEVWKMPSEPYSITKRMWKHFVEVHKDEKECTLSWKEPGMMGFWYYIEVIGHELGHHFRNQYRSKRKRSIMNEELIANMHSHRFLFFMRKKRKQKFHSILDLEANLKK